jgi:hypothetical protein
MAGWCKSETFLLLLHGVVSGRHAVKNTVLVPVVLPAMSKLAAVDPAVTCLLLRPAVNQHPGSTHLKGMLSVWSTLRRLMLEKSLWACHTRSLC